MTGTRNWTKNAPAGYTGGRHAETVQVLLGELPDEVLDTLALVVIIRGFLRIFRSWKRCGRNIFRSGVRSNLLIHMEKGNSCDYRNQRKDDDNDRILGKIICDWHPHTFVVGNIGNPYTSVVEEMPEDSVTVAEMSSFQLETIRTFRPKVSALSILHRII